MIGKFKYLLLLSALFGATAVMHGQQKERSLEVRGVAELDMQPLAIATATLYDGSNLVKSVTTNSDGTFSFVLEANKMYTVVVSRKGLVSKKISFNTALPDEETGKWVSEFGMVMVRPCEGVDYSILEKPVDIVKFNARRRSFESDKDYNEQMMPKLQDINMKSANCLEEKYEKLIEQADKQLSQKSYEAALATYQQASEIMPGESYPSKKIADIETIIGKQKSNEEQYSKIIADADGLMAQKQYTEATARYKAAAALKPQDTYAAQKINEIQSIIARQQAEQQAQQQVRQKSVDDAYTAAVAQGDALMKEKKYEAARESYAKALSIKPSESYPRARTQEIDKAIQQQAQDIQNTRKQELADNLTTYLDEGDAQFKAKNYEAARAAYNKALQLNPSEVYAKQQIARIDKLVVSEQESKQKSEDDGYKNAIAQANNAMAQKQFELAKEQYQKALSFKPGDPYAMGKAEEADRLNREQIKSKTEADLQNKQYQDAIAMADRMFQSKDFQGALSGYRQALSIKPGDAYAQQKISGIENAIATDKAAKDKALAAEQAARQKANEEGYKNAISRANTAMAQKQFAMAKEQYQQALSFKPDDALAQGKIAEIDGLLKQEQDRLSAEQARKKQYNDAIAKADNLMMAKDYSGARIFFEEALKIQPAETYPRQKIGEIDNILADQQKAVADRQAKDKTYNDAVKNGDMYFSMKNYIDARNEFNKALAAKPDETYPKNKISEIDNIQKAEQKALADTRAKEDAYNAAMTQANAALVQKQYGLAKDQYQKALSFKPEDATAKSKITEIDAILKQEQDKVAADQARKKQYNDAVARGDKLLAAKDYSNARMAYVEASGIIQAESYPVQKIADIDKILADQQKALADKQAKDKAYGDAIKNGDMYVAQKSYNDARNEYNKALSIKPEETYPKNKIAEIDNMIRTEQKALADAKAKEDAYNAAISSGNNAYNQRKYEEAKGFYNQALKIMPGDTYAKTQITLIDNLLAEQEKKKEEDQARLKQYNDLIALADKAFDAANYPLAKDNYQKALAVMPDNPYPKQKIARIDEINKMLAQQAKNTQQAADNQTSKQSISSTSPLDKLNFKNDAERDIYLNNLKKKYPEGVTLEVYKEKYTETRRYIVIRDNVAGEFRDVLIKTYGGHEYSMNGKTVTQMYFEQQVKNRPGEYFKETMFE